MRRRAAVVVAVLLWGCSGAGERGGDGAVDAAADVGVDAGPDVGVDAAPDVGADAGPDAGPDVGVDAAPDVGVDAVGDVGVDAAPDVGVDGGCGRRCDDGLVCTVDRCVAGRCVHEVAVGWCRIGGRCVKDGTARKGGRCGEVCDAARSRVAWVRVACVRTVAGGGGYGMKDGVGRAARFDAPDGLAAWGGKLYVADTWNNAIREVDPRTGRVRTVAGDGHAGWTDGVGKKARFAKPLGVAVAGDKLYVVDSGNEVIREVDLKTWVVGTAVGTRHFYGDYQGVAVAGGTVMVTEAEHHGVRGVDLKRGVTAWLAGHAWNRGIFGLPGYWETGHVDDGFVGARFKGPGLMAAPLATRVYVADTGNGLVREVKPAVRKVDSVWVKSGGGGALTRYRLPGVRGVAVSGWTVYVTSPKLGVVEGVDLSSGVGIRVAGKRGVLGKADGAGPVARFDSPSGVAVIGKTLYVADTGNDAIRAIDLP